MPNPYEVVSEINSVLISRTPKSPQELAELASAYAVLCVEANRRLKRCGDFLRRGLRAEAIYHAEVEPDLLDLLATLDLVRVNDWNGVCMAQKLEPAQPLLLDVARELNEAYTADLSASHLMKRLRLLSLGEAPIVHRLAVLRSLRQMDPASAVLEKDVREFESVRLREIASEAKSAYEEQDEARLAALGRELSEAQWVSGVPDQLPGSIASCRRKLQVDRAIHQLEQILPELHNAYAASSYEECAAMLAHWDGVVSQARIEVPGELQSQVQPIRDFTSGIEQQRGAEQRFANACGALSLALDEPTGAADLNRLYREVLSFDQPISDDLEARYRSKIGEIELGHRRKVRLVAGLSILAVLLAGAGVAVMIDYYQGVVALREARLRSAQLVGAAISIEDKREGDNEADLERASEHFKKLEKDTPRLASDAEIAAARQKLTDAIRHRDGRIQQFNEAMRRLRESGLENPDRGAMDRAKATARSNAEKLVLIRWEQDFDDFWKKKVDEAAVVLLKRADELKQAVEKELSDEKIRELMGADQEAIRGGNTDVQRNFAKWQEEHTKLSADSAAQVASLPEQFRVLLDSQIAGGLLAIGLRLKGKQPAIQAIIDNQQKGKAEEAAVRQVGDSAATAEALAAALKDFAAKFPESPRKAKFLKAADASADWSCMIELQALAGGWTETPLPATAEKRKECADAAAAFYKKYPKAPYRKAVGEYMAYLAVVPSAAGDREEWRLLSERMANVLMQVYAFEYQGQVYYCLKDAKPQDKGSLGGWRMSYIPGLSTEEADLAVLDCKEASVAMPKPTPSAHFRLCTKVRRMISEVSAANWDRIGLDIANAVLEYDPAKAETEKVPPLDPIARVMILEVVLRTAKACGWGADEQIDGALKTITGLMLSEDPPVPWPNPNDDRAKEKRAAAANALKKIGRLDPSVPAANRASLLGSLPGQLFIARGALLCPAGKWELRGPGQSALLPGRIVCAVVESGTSGLVLQKIADVGPDGKLVFASDEPPVPEGSMVFICKGPEKP